MSENDLMGRKNLDKPPESVRLPKAMWKDFNNLLASYGGKISNTDLAGASLVAYLELGPEERVKCIQQARNWDLRTLLLPEPDAVHGAREAEQADIDAKAAEEAESHEKPKGKRAIGRK